MPQVVAALQAASARRDLGHGAVPAQRIGPDDLRPAVAGRERPKTFRVGSREYDPQKLGLKQPAGATGYSTRRRTGNHNTGHEFNTGYKPWKEGDPPSGGLIGPLLTQTSATRSSST